MVLSDMGILSLSYLPGKLWAKTFPNSQMVVDAGTFAEIVVCLPDPDVDRSRAPLAVSVIGSSVSRRPVACSCLEGETRAFAPAIGGDNSPLLAVGLYGRNPIALRGFGT